MAEPDDLVVRRPQGLYCPPGDFFIDPWRPVDRAVITHGHSDHARVGHGHYLAHRDSGGVLRARLGAPSLVHRLAAPLLLEGLSLWHQRPLSVVLSVPESGAESPLTLSLSDGFRFGDSTLCYAVDVFGPVRRPGRRLGGPGDFRALRRAMGMP